MCTLQGAKCHVVLTTGLFGRHSCLGTHGTSLDLKSKPAWLFPLTCVLWQTDRCPVLVQMHRIHGVAWIHKWQIIVKYTSGEPGLRSWLPWSLLSSLVIICTTTIDSQLFYKTLSVFIRFIQMSYQIAIISLYSIHSLDVITEMCVYCAVRTESF